MEIPQSLPNPNYTKNPIKIVPGNSPVIFTGPHNGTFVPAHLDFLGMPEAWFSDGHHDARHEAFDIGMARVFARAIEINNDAHSYLYANYSRLVADVNRLTHDRFCFSDLSVDTNTPISGNCDLSDEACTERLKEVYYPYMTALNSLIDVVQRKHGGAILIDMHSFTPTFQGQSRDTEVGTLQFEHHPILHHVARRLKLFCEQNMTTFKIGYPYRHGDHATPSENMSLTKEIYYTGIEIRNDCLATQQGVDLYVGLMRDLAADLVAAAKHEPSLLVRSKTALQAELENGFESS